MVVQADLSGRIKVFDAEFCHVLGYEPDDLHDKSIIDITENEYKSVTTVMFDNAVRTGTGFTLEKVFCDASGGSVPALVHVCALRDERMNISAMVAIVQSRCRWEA